MLGRGRQNDLGPACELIDRVAAEYVLADKASDAGSLCQKIIEQGGDPVVPPRRNRKCRHAYDGDLYKERNRLERFFSRIKDFRRIATRYDKLASTFTGFNTFAAVIRWLK